MKRFMLIFSFLLFWMVSPVKSQEEFLTSVDAQYNVDESGKTIVSHTITLTNEFSSIHAASYIFSIYGSDINSAQAVQGDKQLPIEVEKEADITKIKVQFTDAVVGKGKSRTFVISYVDSGIVYKNGQVWEIRIPRVQNIKQYESYVLQLSVPKQFGNPAFVSGQPARVDTENTIAYTYSQEQLIEGSVLAAFGDFQVFSFELSYHLKNPYTSKGVTQIALPPDTAYQRVYFESINPLPTKIDLDQDGNWLATFELNPKERVSVVAKGNVQVFVSPQDFYPKNLYPSKEQLYGLYLKRDRYWESDDQDIHELAQKLKTPQAIYDYTVSTLNYDYSRIREDVKRLGAKYSLQNPNSALCMEFTDLFISLSRAAGIPSREINGYAYSENPSAKPLSLIADVLHSWPEFWDEANGVWKPVDPTWEKTTGGVDYFSNFDLSHIVFAIHGISSTAPLPAGSYKLADNLQKDVYVSYGNLPLERTKNLNIQVHLNKKVNPFSKLSGKLIFKNKGLTALYDVVPDVIASNGVIKLESLFIPFIAPYSSASIPFAWDTGLLLMHPAKEPSINVFAQNSTIKYTLSRENLYWETAGIFSLLLILTVLFLSLLIMRKRIVLGVLYAINRISKYKNLQK